MFKNLFTTLITAINEKTPRNTIIEYILILLLIIALIVGIATIVIYNNKKKIQTEKYVDYRVFYIHCISFLPLGIILPLVTKNQDMISFMGLGAVYSYWPC